MANLPNRNDVDNAEPLDFSSTASSEGSIIPILVNGYRVELNTKGLSTGRLLNAELDRVANITKHLAKMGIEPAAGVFDIVGVNKAQEPAQAAPAAPAVPQSTPAPARNKWTQGQAQVAQDVDPLAGLVGTQAYIHPSEGLPCCPKHRGRDGQPRTMKEGRGGAFCTAADTTAQGGYCGWKVNDAGILARKGG